MKIAIIVAMDKEKVLIEHLIENAEHRNNTVIGTIGKHQILLAQSGIGKVCAAVATTEIINDFHPDYVINTGVAGGIDKSLKVLDVVIGQDMVYHDVICFVDNNPGQIQGFPTYFHSDSHLVQLAKQINPNVHGGLICTGDQFLTDKQVLQRIKTTFPAGLAVDMESTAIAHTCYIKKVPFLSLRVISDTLGVEDNEAQYENFWEEAPATSFHILQAVLQNL